MPLSEASKKLADYYDDKVERVGFVMPDGEIIEVQNVCPEPEEGFDVSDEDILKYGDKAIATWHTHPGATNNLSVNDYETYLGWPNLSHFIVGMNGVRRYVVENGNVLIAA